MSVKRKEFYVFKKQGENDKSFQQRKEQEREKALAFFGQCEAAEFRFHCPEQDQICCFGIIQNQIDNPSGEHYAYCVRYSDAYTTIDFDDSTEWGITVYAKYCTLMNKECD